MQQCTISLPIYKYQFSRKEIGRYNGYIGDYINSLNLHELSHEEFGIIFYNVRGKIMGHSVVAVGGRNSVKVDLIKLLKECILTGCFAVAVFHNHPGEVKKPSSKDLEISKKVKEALKYIGIKYLGSFISYGKDKFIKIGEKDVRRNRRAKRRRNGRGDRIRRKIIRGTVYFM